MSNTENSLEFRIELTRRVEAPIGEVFESLILQLGPEGSTPEGQPLAMKLEAFPGGRWYRDLGDDNGHHWAHVQAIKRPTLMELSGPLFMSLGVCNNIQYRLSEDENGTQIQFVHHCFGLVPQEVQQGLLDGWTSQLEAISKRCEGVTKQLAGTSH